MSLQNVLRKLKKEATVKAELNGHELARFEILPNGELIAACKRCPKGARIVPAVNVGTHVVDGEALEDQCPNQFQVGLEG